MLKFIRTFLFFLLVVVLFHPSVSHAYQSTGKLTGIVVNWDYARVTDTIIIFEGESFTKYVRTDEEGAYEVELPAGTHVVRAIRQGFIPRRVKFNVEAGTTRTLNMILDVEPVRWVKCPKGSVCL